MDAETAVKMFTFLIIFGLINAVIWAFSLLLDVRKRVKDLEKGKEKL